MVLLFTLPQTNTSHLKRLGFICKWGFSLGKRDSELTASSHLKTDGWNTTVVSFWGPLPIFRGYVWLLVSGRVYITFGWML